MDLNIGTAAPLCIGIFPCLQYTLGFIAKLFDGFMEIRQDDWKYSRKVAFSHHSWGPADQTR